MTVGWASTGSVTSERPPLLLVLAWMIPSHKPVLVTVLQGHQTKRGHMVLSYRDVYLLLVTSVTWTGRCPQESDHVPEVRENEVSTGFPPRST